MSWNENSVKSKTVDQNGKSKYPRVSRWDAVFEICPDTSPRPGMNWPEKMDRARISLGEAWVARCRQVWIMEWQPNRQ